MTIRGSNPDGNASPAPDVPRPAAEGSGDSLLTARSAVVLGGGLIIGAVAGVLASMAGAVPAEAVLAGCAAAAAAIRFLNAVIA